MSRSIFFLLVLAPSTFAEPRLDQHGDPLPDGAIARVGTVRNRIGSAFSTRAWTLSPDGKILAVEDRLGVTLWDVESGKPVKQFLMAESQSHFLEFDLRFSSDGKSIVRLAYSVVSVLDSSTGKIRWSHDVKKLGRIRQISLVTGPDRVVALNEDRKVLYFDAETGRVLETLEIEEPIWTLSPSGNYFIGWNGGVPMVPHLVDAKSGKVRARFPEAKGMFSVGCVLSPDDRVLYVPREQNLYSFDAASGKLLQVLTPPPDTYSDGYSVRWSLSPDCATAYSASSGRPTQRRDLKADKWLEPLPASFGGSILELPGSNRVLQIGMDGVLRRYDLATLKQIPQTDGFEGSLFANPSPDAKKIVVSSESVAGRRMDLIEVAGRTAWSVSTPAFSRFVWSSDGMRVACVGSNEIAIRDAGTGRVQQVLKPPGNELISNAIFSDESTQIVAVLTYGQGLAVYDLATGKLASSNQFDVEEADIGFSPDCRTLVLDSEKSGIALFDLATARTTTGWLRDKLTDRSRAGLPAPTFSQDGSIVVSWDVMINHSASTETCVAVIRDRNTLERKRFFELKLPRGFEFDLSPDGQWLAIGDSRGDLHLWDVAAGEKLGIWKGHRDRINNLGFMGLGRVVTSSDDLTALIWELRPNERRKGELWNAISSNDARAAFGAVWAIADDANGPAILRGKISPAKRAAADQVDQWLADLGADKFNVRELATKQLQELGRLIEPELRSARGKVANEEVRTRLDAIIAKIQRERVGVEIVHARAVAAMERSGSIAAKKLLDEWATGAPGARLTIDAMAAQRRLSASR